MTLGRASAAHKVRSNACLLNQVVKVARVRRVVSLGEFSQRRQDIEQVYLQSFVLGMVDHGLASPFGHLGYLLDFGHRHLQYPRDKSPDQS